METYKRRHHMLWEGGEYSAEPMLVKLRVMSGNACTATTVTLGEDVKKRVEVVKKLLPHGFPIRPLLGMVPDPNCQDQ